jgi:hypothetical protein
VIVKNHLAEGGHNWAVGWYSLAKEVRQRAVSCHLAEGGRQRAVWSYHLAEGGRQRAVRSYHLPEGGSPVLLCQRAAPHQNLAEGGCRGQLPLMLLRELARGQSALVSRYHRLRLLSNLCPISRRIAHTPSNIPVAAAEVCVHGW